MNPSELARIIARKVAIELDLNPDEEMLVKEVTEEEILKYC